MFWHPTTASTITLPTTLAAGKGLCDTAVVEQIVREAPQRIGELISWGTEFDRIDGEVALTREGGHSHPRIVHALGDATGRELMRAIIGRARTRPNLRIWQNSFTIDLLTYEGRCRGRSSGIAVGVLRWFGLGRPCWQPVALGSFFRDDESTDRHGDGHAVAFRAGVEVRDMEFMQFHPTVLYIAGSSRHLLTEALRGEGAYLRDRNGYRFLFDYHPDAELAPRDDVSEGRSHAQMVKTQLPQRVSRPLTSRFHLHRGTLPRYRGALPRLRPRHHA